MHWHSNYLTGLVLFWTITGLSLVERFSWSLKIHEFEMRHSRPDHPLNVIDVTFDQIYFLVFNISFKSDETPLSTHIFRNGKEVFELLPSTNEPTVFTPFASQDLTYMSEPIEGFLQGTIMIHRPKIVHEGFYKIVSKVIRDQSEEVLIDAKVVYIRARSNCTQVEGRSMSREPCDLHLEYWCKNPVYPLSSIRILTFFGSSLDRTFAISSPVESVNSIELEDGRFHVTINYTQPELAVMPPTFYSQMDWYQFNTLIRSDIEDFEKRDQCNGTGTLSPNAILHLTAQTIFPSETPIYFETTASVTNATTTWWWQTSAKFLEDENTTTSMEPGSGCDQMRCFSKWVCLLVLMQLLFCHLL